MNNRDRVDPYELGTAIALGGAIGFAWLAFFAWLGALNP
jgi:hypothetical protein